MKRSRWLSLTAAAAITALEAWSFINASASAQVQAQAPVAMPEDAASILRPSEQNGRAAPLTRVEPGQG